MRTLCRFVRVVVVVVVVARAFLFLPRASAAVADSRILVHVPRPLPLADAAPLFWGGLRPSRPQAIRNRVLMAESGASEQPIGDMTISEALEKAKEQAQSGGLFSFGRRRGEEG